MEQTNGATRSALLMSASRGHCPCVHVDSMGLIRFSNSEFMALIGDAEELRLSERVHPNDCVAVFERISDAVSSGIHGQFTCRIRDVHGHWIVTRARFTPLAPAATSAGTDSTLCSIEFTDIREVPANDSPMNSLLDAVPIPMVLLNGSGVIVSMNAAARHWTRDEVMEGQHYRDFARTYAGEERGGELALTVRDICREADPASNRVVEYEVEGQRHALRVEVARVDRHHVSGDDQCIVSHIDLTPEVELRDQLATTLVRQRQALQGSPIAIMSITPDRVVTFAEGGLLETLATAEAGKPAGLFDGITSSSAFDHALNGEVSTFLTLVYGRWVDLTLSAMHAVDGRVAGITVLAVDVTEREAAEDRVRSYVRMVDAATEGAGIGTWEADTATNTGEWSPEMSRIWGLPKATHRRVAMGEAFIQRAHPDDRERVRAALLHALKTGTGFRLQYRINRWDGDLRHIIVTGRAVEFRDGWTHRMVGVVQDITEQVRRIDDLELLRRDLEQSQRIAGIGSWRLDLKTGANEWSDEVYRISGTTRETFVPTRENRESLYHPDDMPVIWIMRESMSRGEPFTTRYRYVRSDGSICWVENHGVPQFGAAGQATSYIGTVQDITDQVERERTMARTNRHLQVAQAVAQVGSWERDPDTLEGYWSDEMYRILGLSRGAVLPTPETLASLVHPDDLASRELARAHREDGKDVVEYTARIRRGDGADRWIRVRSLRDYDSSNPGYIIGTAQDVTEAVEAEAALRESESRLREAHEIAQLGHWHLDIRSRRLTWSEQVYRIFGLDAETYTPGFPDFPRRVHPDDAEASQAAFDQALRERSHYDVTHRILRPDGSVRVVRETGRVIADALGDPLEVHGIVQDITDTAQAQDSLRESEARLREAQAIAHLGHWVWDITTNELEWSAEIYRIFGVSPENFDASYLAFLSFIHPDDRQSVEDAVAHTLNEDVPYDIRHRIVTADGTIRIVRELGRVERNADNAPTRMVGIALDITDFAEQEAMLLRIQGSLEHAQRLAHLGPYEWNATKDEMWVADETYRILGVRPEDGPPSTQAFLRLLKDSDERQLQTLFRDAVAGSDPLPPLDTTHRITTKSGEVRTIRHLGRMVRQDGDVIVRGALMDITETVRLAERADQAARETASIITASPLPIILIEESGTIVMANPATQRIFGWPPDELLGQDISVLAADVTPEEHHRYLQHYLRTGEASTDGGLVIGRTREIRGRRKDGTEFPARLTVAESVVDDRRQFIGIVMDLTDFKAAESQLLQMQKSQALGTLVAGIAHDFNNLLTAIQGGIEMAATSPGEAKWLHIADQASIRAADLVRQLLRISRQDEARAIRINATDLLHETQMLIHEVLDRRIWFKTEAIEDLPEFIGDPGQLQQVLINLVVNSRDAVLGRAESEGGGYLPSITLGARMQDEAGEPGIQITVTDNGAGMSEEVLARAFDPFFTTKPVDAGTGLGLATVSGIIEQHGGRIGVDSRPGEGTTMRIWLPLAPLSGADEEASVPESHVDLAETPRDEAIQMRPRILVVDDEVEIGAIAQGFLHSSGYEVTYVAGGKEAIEEITSKPEAFQLAVLDLNMPAPDGWAVLAAIREHAPELPVIVASGYADAGEVLAAGADSLLPKPYTRTQLTEAVRELLHRD